MASEAGSHGCPRPESNQRTRFRKPLLYPLSYGGALWLFAGISRGTAPEVYLRPLQAIARMFHSRLRCLMRVARIVSAHATWSQTKIWAAGVAGARTRIAHFQVFCPSPRGLARPGERLQLDKRSNKMSNASKGGLLDRTQEVGGSSPPSSTSQKTCKAADSDLPEHEQNLGCDVERAVDQHVAARDDVERHRRWRLPRRVAT